MGLVPEQLVFRFSVVVDPMRRAYQSTFNTAFVVIAATALLVPSIASAQLPYGSEEIPFAPRPLVGPDGRLAATPANQLTDRPMASQFVGLTKDTVIWPTREFAIPFNVESSGSEPVEVQLFVSRGPGNQWKLIDRKLSTEEEFAFEATGDGLYWFATRTTNDVGNTGTDRSPISEAISPQLKNLCRCDTTGSKG